MLHVHHVHDTPTFPPQLRVKTLQLLRYVFLEFMMFPQRLFMHKLKMRLKMGGWKGTDCE